jgi:hypothetical protein
MWDRTGLWLGNGISFLHISAGAGGDPIGHVTRRDNLRTDSCLFGSVVFALRLKRSYLESELGRSRKSKKIFLFCTVTISSPWFERCAAPRAGRCRPVLALDSRKRNQSSNPVAVTAVSASLSTPSRIGTPARPYGRRVGCGTGWQLAGAGSAATKPAAAVHMDMAR